MFHNGSIIYCVHILICLLFEMKLSMLTVHNRIITIIYCVHSHTVHVTSHAHSNVHCTAAVILELWLNLSPLLYKSSPLTTESTSLHPVCEGTRR